MCLIFNNSVLIFGIFLYLKVQVSASCEKCNTHAYALADSLGVPDNAGCVS